MAIQAHKCNQAGCKGFILFENADFNYKESLNNGSYVLDKPKCSECEKEFLVVIGHVLIEVDEDEDLVEEIPECCYIKYEKREQEREQTTRTDARNVLDTNQ